MEKLLAFCGLSCSTCPVYLATREKAKDAQLKMRVEIAGQCNQLYKTNLTAEDINDCDGCGNFPGRLFSGCTNCGIRRCALARNINSCSDCDSYPCEQLYKHFNSYPEAKRRLEEKRTGKYDLN